MSGPNVDLLNRTLAHIEANPDEWDQHTWRRKTECGTAMCFAGWAVTFSGGQWTEPAVEIPDPIGYDRSHFLTAEPEDYADEACNAAIPVDDRACRVLGLTSKQADRLFWGGNTLADVREIVAEICATAGGGAR